MASAPKPTFRKYSLAALVQKSEGAELTKPEPVYRFSSGALKLSTDRTEKGFYKKS